MLSTGSMRHSADTLGSKPAASTLTLAPCTQPTSVHAEQVRCVPLGVCHCQPLARPRLLAGKQPLVPKGCSFAVSDSMPPWALPVGSTSMPLLETKGKDSGRGRQAAVQQLPTAQV